MPYYRAARRLEPRGGSKSLSTRQPQISTYSSAGGCAKSCQRRARCRSLGAESAADAANLVTVETENRTVTLEHHERVQARSVVDTPAAMAREAAVRVCVGLPADVQALQGATSDTPRLSLIPRSWFHARTALAATGIDLGETT